MSTQTVTPQAVAWDEHGTPIEFAKPTASGAAPSTSQAAPQGAAPASVGPQPTAWDEFGKPVEFAKPASTGPTDAQKAYREATASGPFAPAGAAEKAMGAEIGDNTAQAKAALSDTLSAAGETAAGITGAQIPGAIAEALPAVIPSTIEGVKAIGAWAEAHPVHAYLLYNVIKDLVPGAKKAIGLVKGAPIE
jgi:hypothetical protein